MINLLYRDIPAPHTDKDKQLTLLTSTERSVLKEFKASWYTSIRIFISKSRVCWHQHSRKKDKVIPDCIFIVLLEWSSILYYERRLLFPPLLYPFLLYAPSFFLFIDCYNDTSYILKSFQKGNPKVYKCVAWIFIWSLIHLLLAQAAYANYTTWFIHHIKRIKWCTRGCFSVQSLWNGWRFRACRVWYSMILNTMQLIILQSSRLSDIVLYTLKMIHVRRNCHNESVTGNIEPTNLKAFIQKPKLNNFFCLLECVGAISGRK